MKRCKRRRFLSTGIGREFGLAILMQVVLIGASWAQQKPLMIESSNMQPSVVLGRPILTWWDVKIPGSGLLVGKFRFNINSEGFHFTTLETEELTLNGPEQRIRVMFPSIDCAMPIDRLNVDISFEGKKFKGDLGQQILRVPFSTKSVFICLVGESRTARKRSMHREKVLEQLKFEQFIPSLSNPSSFDDDSEYVQTIYASIDPADFPSEPLAYCGYDVAVLMHDEFRGLRKAQLEGLLNWIRAGGSLYLEPNGVLEPYHLDFLRELTKDDTQGLVFQLDLSGKLPVDTVPDSLPAIAVKCGLGDVVIRTAEPDEDFNPPIEQWRSIAGPLWKWRHQPVPKPQLMNYVVGPNGQPVQEAVSNPDPWGFSIGLFNRSIISPAELLDRLMPEGVRMVPLSVLMLILGVFVLLIGPGDYYVLGWLRARKFTWVTFPLATLAVTALTVWLSNSYMSTAESRRALIVQDIASSGDIVRTNRFELLFVASTHRVNSQVEKALLTPLKTGLTFDMAAPAGGGLAYNTRNGGMVAVPVMQQNGLSRDGQIRQSTAQMLGRIPVQYVAQQDLAKWTPQINRLMFLPGQGDASEIDWEQFNLKFDEAQSMNQHVVPQSLLENVRSRFGQSAMVACFNGPEGWAYDRTPGWRSNRSNNPIFQFNAMSMQQTGITGSAGVQMVYEADLFRWIYQASVAPTHLGVFSLARRTAPKGGVNCEDLLLLDMSDPREWLLVVIVPQENDYIVYRKLMRLLN